MKLLANIWRWGAGGVLGLLVAGYVLTLVVHNTYNLTGPSKSPIDEYSGKILSATGTHQRWNMFAPNVGTLSYSPIVVVVFKDGKRLALHSHVEPDLPNWAEDGLIPNDLEGEARDYSWRFHLGDGRIRKFESKAASAQDKWWRVRATFTRWRASKWLEENPGMRDKVKRFELWRCKIRHPGYGRKLHCEAVEVLPVRPYVEGDKWPIVIDPTYPPYWG